MSDKRSYVVYIKEKLMIKRLSKNTRQILTALLAAAMTFTSIPVNVSADEIIDENILLSEDLSADETVNTETSLFQGSPLYEGDIISEDGLSYEVSSVSSDILDDGTGLTLSGNDTLIPEDVSGDLFFGEMPEIDPIEVENPSFDPGCSIMGDTTETLPPKFISPSLPQLRSQSPYGACWTFSSMALAEMSMIKQGKATPENIDLSELHLAYFSYNTVTDPLGGTEGDKNEMNTKDGKVSPGDFMRRGGNRNYSKNILASWTGAANEADAPYSQAGTALSSGLDHAIAYKDAAHMTAYYDVQLSTTDQNFTTKKFNIDGINAAKRLIYNYGAIGLSYYTPSGTSASTSSDLYSSDYNSYFDPTIRGTNHAITVVGWDDDFSKDHFSNTKKPEGNGAWLVRNSWTNGGSYDAAHQNYSGYFWLSYYSLSNGDTANAFVFDTSDNYDHNYQYDGSMVSGKIAYTGPKWFQGANVFTAQSETGDVLSAVSFATPTSNVDYKIDIYSHIEGENSDPSKGTLVEDATTEGSTVYAGYHTIPLKNKVRLAKGERFAVSVRLEADSSPALYSEASADSSWLTATASIKPGQSFTYSGSKWNDLSATTFSNLRIKAFTNNDLPKAAVTTAPAARTGLVFNGSSQALVTAGTAKNGTLKYRIGETGSYITGIPSVTDAGTYTVYYKAFGDHINYADSDEFKVTVTVDKAASTIKTSPAAIPNLKYTDKPLALINAGSVTGGQLLYKLEDGEYGTSVPTATQVGKYLVYYKVVGDKNHKDIPETKIQTEISYISAPSGILYDGAAKKDPYIEQVTISAPGYTVGVSTNAVFSASYTIEGKERGYGNIETVLHFKDSEGHITDSIIIKTVIQKRYDTLSRILTVPGNYEKEYSYDLSNLLPDDVASGVNRYSIKSVSDENGLFSKNPYIDPDNENNIKLPVSVSGNGIRTAQITIGVKNEYYFLSDAVLTVRAEVDNKLVNTVSIDLSNGTSVNVSSNSVSSFIGEYEYTGSAIKPQIGRITYNGNLLVQGRDYSVSYKNNIKTNENVSPTAFDQKHDPQMIITFKGDYTGKHILTFKINRISYADLYMSGKITAEPVSAIVKKNRKGYTVQKLKPVIYYEGKKLRLNTDYSLEYPDTGKPGAYAAPCTMKNAWKITIKAKGLNYRDSFTISEVLFENTLSSNHIPLNSGSIKVTLASTRVEYQNESTEEKRFWPNPTITYVNPKNKADRQTLVKDTHYTVNVINGSGIGTATYVFTAIPGSGYVGSTTKTFRITGAELAGKTIVRINNYNSVVYEKDGVKPGVNVIYTKNGNPTQLYEGIDYKVVYGRNKIVRNSSVKNAPYVQIQGIGNYRGKVIKTFTISPKNIGTLSSNNLIVGDVVYSKSKNAYKKTTVILYDTNGKKLKQGTDYYISEYKTNSGNQVPKTGETVKITIRGKNNYNGSISTEYKILKNSISKTNIRFYNSKADKDSGRKTTAFAYTGYEIEPKYIDIYFGSGKKEHKITEGTDYEIAGYYNNIDKGTGYIVIKGKGDYAGVKVFRFRITARKIAR